MPKTIIAILLVLCSSYVFAKDPPGTIYELVPKENEAYEIKDGVIHFRHGDAGIMIQVATPDVRAHYYADRGASMVGDPFTKSPDLVGSTVFLVTLINRTQGALTFTPNYVALKIKTEAEFPMDFSVLLGSLAMYPSTEQKILTKSIFHSPETIPAGQIVSKFLILPGLPPKSLELKVEFDSLFFQDKEMSAVFWFIKRKKL